MPKLNVNPTRMELKRLKRKLVTARRGHSLLKDKRDELMKKFLEMVRRNRELRNIVEEKVMRTHQSFTVAAAVMSPEALRQSLMMPRQKVTLSLTRKNIMSVNTPVFAFEYRLAEGSNIYPYGFASTSGELDDAVAMLAQTMKELLELAQVEKSAQLLAQEIEKTRRRVNALEYVMIPQLEETVRYIAMKLDENERGNLTRLMKVKDMMVKAQIEAHEREMAENG